MNPPGYVDTCRACLMRKKPPLNHLYRTEEAQSTKPTLSDLVYKCFMIKVPQNDGLPDKLCHKCTDQLINAYSFRMLFEKSASNLSAPNAESGPADQTDDLFHLIDSIDFELNTDECLNTEDNQLFNFFLADTPEPDIGDVLDPKPPTSAAESHAPEGDSRLKNCPVCGKAFQCTSHLNRHILHHSGEKPFSCGICTKTFSQESNLKAHTALVHNEPNRLFKCTDCSKMFTTMNNLKVHTRVHSGEHSYQCNICAKSFTQSSYLKIHRNTHTGLKSHQCTLCSKRFTQSLALRKHLRVVHNGAKPFQCAECKRRFSSKDALRKHVRIHTGEEPFFCEVCGEHFKQSGARTLHAQRCHTVDVPQLAE